MKQVLINFNRVNKKLIITGTLLGMLGIILDAFASHGLENLMDKDAIRAFETGVRYQIYHAFLLLILGLTSFIRLASKVVIFYLVITGVILFSGSIYGLTTNTLTGFDFKTIAFLTPIGGLFLILAWSFMLIKIVKTKID